MGGCKCKKPRPFIYLIYIHLMRVKHVRTVDVDVGLI